jgi:hypothetical protein
MPVMELEPVARAASHSPPVNVVALASVTLVHGLGPDYLCRSGSFRITAGASGRGESPATSSSTWKANKKREE